MDTTVYNKYGSRKWIVCLAVVLLATILVATKCISDTVFASVMIANLGGYYSVNLGQKAWTTAGKVDDGKTTG